MTRHAARRMGALVLSLAACNGAAPAERTVGSGVIALGMPARHGPLQRAAVELDHTAHTRALADEGCKACHLSGDDGRLVALFARTADPEDTGELMELYHERCIGCHRERGQQGKPGGPLTCGECHVRRSPATSTRVPLRFDYSLHGRHVASMGEQNYSECHHVYDEAARKLVPGAGREEGCRACHGAKAEGRRLALRDAAHRSCISCHLQRAADSKTSGPVLCAQCHESAAQARVARLEQPPPIKRERRSVAVIHAEGSKSAPVVFDHQGHEARAPFCSACHHRGLRGCDGCHTSAGDARGGGVTLEAAYHHPTSRHGCVGCHQAATRQLECAGCHSQLVGAPPRLASCMVCHRPGAQGAASRPAVPRAHELAPLPAASDAFPETVTIGVLAREYRPAVLPHARIVARLDAAQRTSTLARAFHKGTDTLCAGCHHRSPLGARPPACRSCHGREGKAGQDHPRLLEAYHRQCIGCHQAMSLRTDCASCHLPSGQAQNESPEGAR